MLMNQKSIKFSVTNNNNLELYPDSCIVSGVFEESYFFPSTMKINKISQGYISSFLQRSTFNGSLGQNLLLYDAPYFLNKPILLVGCGKKNEFNDNIYRKVISQIIKFCNQVSINKILLLLCELDILQYDNYWKIRHSIALFNKEFYTFNKFKSNPIIKSSVLHEIIAYIQSDTNQLQCYEKAVTDGLAIASGINIAKDLSNMPPNYCNPKYLSNKTAELPNFFKNLSVDILNESDIEKIGMQAYLAVGKGSQYPAVMPIIKYQKHPKGSDYDPIILIGKGLTFDSGGISIKPSFKMDEMKYDMCGAACIYAIMCIISQLNLPLNVIGILAISENMINSKSLKPGDIITTLSGQTVEVLDTDAEGRLVLCDVLTYVQKYHPKTVIDVATLTGACVVALGNRFSGVMSNNQTLIDDLILASNQTKDYVWRLPLDTAFEKQLKSTYADMTNVGGNSGGVLTAACFLNKFAHKYNWAHLDIAGTAWNSNNRDKSSTGRPVELLSQFLINIVR